MEQDVARSKHVRETEFSLEKLGTRRAIKSFESMAGTFERPGELHTRSVPPLIHGPVTGIPLSRRAESARSFSARPRKNRARNSGEEEISRPTRVVAGEGEGKKKGRGARRSEMGSAAGRGTPHCFNLSTVTSCPGVKDIRHLGR